MLFKFNLILLFIGFFLSSNAQRYDYQWAFGYDEDIELLEGISILDFNNSEVNTYFKQGIELYQLGPDGSITNNPNTGQLALNTNGCQIRDGRFKVFSGDDWMHGDKYRWACEFVGVFPGIQNLLLLPDLINSNLSYCITKDVIEAPDDTYSPNLYWSTIRLNSEGEYSFSGLKKINTTDLVGGEVTAIPNHTKNGWWLLQPRNHTNQIETYLIGSDTMELKYVQEVNDLILDIKLVSVGQNTFSPDGTKYAFNSETGVHLYDFDNETGLLSNYRHIYYQPPADSIALGLCFSPNSRFIYVTNADNLYQIDTEIMDEPILIAQHFTIDSTGTPLVMGMMYLGPDCRIYMTPNSRSFYLHVIHEPDQKGFDCTFQHKAIKTPSRISLNLPNMPQYRYLTGCDPSIRFPFPIVSSEEHSLEKGFDIYPNPVVQSFHIEIYESAEIEELVLVDLLGKIVKNIPIKDIKTEVDVSGLPAGVYFIRDIPGRYLLQKLVKM